MRRWQLRKGPWAVQVEYDDSGWVWLDFLRKVHPRFKRGRITDVLQLQPDQLATGVIFNTDTAEQVGTPLEVILRTGALTIA